MTLRADVLDVIAGHAMSRPRSLQVAPGVSDLAQGCDHCLAARLAGWPKARDAAWLAYIGTAVHASVAEAFSANGSDYLVEHPVRVGRVGAWMVDGTADLVHLPSRTVIDFKTAGKGVMDLARRGEIPAHYRRQVNLYAYGLHAERVALCFLPRTTPRLEDAVWWEERADTDEAERTMARARRLADGLLLGDARAFIGSLPREAGCYDCARYDDRPAPATMPGAVLGSIMEG